MRVLMISSLYPTPATPQYAPFIVGLESAIREAGVYVDVIVPRRREELLAEGMSGEADRIEHVTFLPCYRLPFYFNLFLAGPSCCKLIVRKLSMKLKEYDVFHGHGALPEGYCAVELARKYGKKAVVQLHGRNVLYQFSDRGQILGWPNRVTARYVYTYADAVVGVSREVCRQVNLQCGSAKTYPVYNGYDPSVFFPGEGHRHDRFRLVSVGNLAVTKGYRQLLEALVRLKKKMVSFECYIYGRGPLEEEMRRFLHDNDLDGAVVLKGYQSVDTIANALRDSDLFVLPSYDEALGCVYLEAMACGVPAIGCETQGIAEIINDEVNGYLVPCESNVDRLVDIICTLMTDENKRCEVRQNALKTIRDYTWGHAAEDMVRIYRAL